MKLFQNRMLSVRQILIRSRTRTIVAVVSTSILATLGIGMVVYAAIGQIEPEANTTYITSNVYDTGDASLMLQSENMQAQTAAIKEYLIKLQAEVSDSTAAIEEISAMYKEDSEKEETKTTSAIFDVQSDLKVLQDKIGTALNQIARIDGSLTGEDGLNHLVQDGAEELMQELNGMLDSINERYLITQSEMDNLVTVLNRNGMSDQAEISETVSALKAFAEQESDALAGLRAQLEKTSGMLDNLGEQATKTLEAIDTLGIKMGESSQDAQEMAAQLAATQADIAALGKLVGQLGEDQKTIVDMLNTTNQILSETGSLIKDEKGKLAELSAQLEEQKQNLQTLGNVLDAQTESMDTMKQELDSQSTRINEISGRVAFPLGIDSNGEYGYYKSGADSVTPFRRPGLPTGEKVALLHTHDGSSTTGGACFNGTPSVTTITRACIGSYSNGWTEYPMSYCSSCKMWEFNTQAVCTVTGGAHTLIMKNATHCPYHKREFMSGESCPGVDTITTRDYPQTCDKVSCGQLYIENGNIKRAADSCVLRVCTEAGDAEIQIITCLWTVTEGGVMSGDTAATEVTALHRGTYTCLVTYQDVLTGKTDTATVTYTVTNLAH